MRTDKDKVAAQRCIYTAPLGLCTGNSPLSREDYLPRGFGKFRDYRVLRDKICEGCNNKFSSLDEVILHSGPETLFRRLSGAQGRRKHAEKAVFYDRSHGRDPIQVLGRTPENDHDIRWNVEGEEGQPLRQIIFRRRDNTLASLPIQDRIKAKKDLLELMALNGLSDAVPVKYYASGESGDLAKLEALIAEIVGPRKLERRVSNDPIVVTVSSTIDLPPEYHRGIAKIAFHFLLAQFPNLSGLESEFDGIKRFIYSGEGNAADFVNLANSLLEPETDPRASYRHLLIAGLGDRIEVGLQLYQGLKIGPSQVPVKLAGGSKGEITLTSDTRNPMLWVVRIGANPSRLSFDGWSGLKFIGYKTRQDGFDGEVRRIHLTKSRLLVSGSALLPAGPYYETLP